MTLKPFTPEELAAWIEEELGKPDPVAGYRLRPGEMTVRSYLEVVRRTEPDLTRKTAYDRLEKMVERGKMKKRFEKVAGNRAGIYWPAEDGEDGD